MQVLLQDSLPPKTIPNIDWKTVILSLQRRCEDMLVFSEYVVWSGFCSMWMSSKRLGLSVLCVLTLASPGFAENSTPSVHLIDGPKKVSVGEGLADLSIPKGYAFADKADTQTLLESMGNPASPHRVGMVLPQDPEKQWFVVLSYDPMGYVKDGEAGQIDAEGLLESLKSGNEEMNQERESQGMPLIKLVGWQEKPFYDKAHHHLVWSLLIESEGEQSVNYNTRILGRHGVTSLNLVAPPAELAALKPELETLVSGYTYTDGKKYADFDPTKDKVADYSLAALIAGGVGVAAAAKTGMLAKLLLMLGLVFKKGWFILVAIGAGLFGKFKGIFTGKSSTETELAPEGPHETEEPEKEAT